MVTRLRCIGATAAFAIALAAPSAPALAQTASQSGYDETGALPETGGSTTPPVGTAPTTPPGGVPGAGATLPGTAGTGATPPVAGVATNGTLPAANASPSTPPSGVLGERDQSRSPSDGGSGALPATAGSGPRPAGTTAGGDPRTLDLARRDRLPFTGSELMIVALLGLLLTATGIAMRHSARLH